MMSTSLRAALVISGSFALSVAVKATLILVLAFVAARAARRVRASLRHLWWASAFGALLVLPPFALLGPAVVIPVETSRGPIATGLTAPDISPPAITARLPATSAGSDARPMRFLPTAAWVAGAWLLGVTLTLVPVAGGLGRLRAVRRAGRRWTARGVGAEPVPVLLCEGIVVPITFGFRRPIVALPSDAPSWSEDDLRRALAHECEHVRRRDWLVHGIARVVCSLYWFHPLVWAAWRHLRLEAERACDDAVLESSGNTAYADQLVRLARRLSCAAGPPSPAIVGPHDLGTRVSAVLDEAQSRGRAGRGASVGMVGLAVAVLGLVSPLRASEKGVALTDATRSFTVASVSANTSGTLIFPDDPHARMSTQAGGVCGPWGWIPYADTCFHATNLSLRELIQFAYGGSALTPPREAVVGGPAWTATSRFDVVARLKRPATVDPSALQQLAAPTQTLLKEHFRLAVHREVRTLPVYALVLAPSHGSHLRPADPQCMSAVAASERTLMRPGRGGSCTQEGGDGYIRASAMSMPQLAAMLANRVRGVVRDRTGLGGRFAVDLTWTNGSTFEAAVQEQLGLRLERTTGPVEVLVIDTVSLPASHR
jgi:uncharacterized protein (TIGR03435 family)